LISDKNEDVENTLMPMIVTSMTRLAKSLLLLKNCNPEYFNIEKTEAVFEEAKKNILDNFDGYIRLLIVNEEHLKEHLEKIRQLVAELPTNYFSLPQANSSEYQAFEGELQSLCNCKYGNFLKNFQKYIFSALKNNVDNADEATLEEMSGRVAFALRLVFD